jgi:adhesin transport system membrane fusion protein
MTNNKKLLQELEGETAKSSSLLLFLIVFILSTLLYWAYVTELDVVIRGQGKTISEGKNQMVQSAESGVIVKNFVKEGDKINAGDLLFEIDLIDLKGQIDQVNDRVSMLQIKQSRLIAESGNNDFLVDPSLEGKKLSFAKSEKQLFDSRRDQLLGKKRILESRRSQRRSEIEELLSDKYSFERNLDLVNLEIEAVEPLVRANLAPETRLITLQRDKENIDGRLKGIPYSINQIEGAIEEIEEQLASEDKSFLTQSLTELSQANLEIEELDARIPLLEKRLERALVTSPINGIVNRITYQSDEAYIKTGDVLLDIVPINDELIVEARIDPKDIAKIGVSDEVKISLTSFDPAKFGRIDGEVINISPDAVSNPDTGEQFYSLKVNMLGSIKDNGGKEVTILPGMVATVEVLSGKRSILDYFWQPLVKNKDLALRE